MKIVSLTGPSCAGKTTLARELFKTGHFCEVVSFTSWKPRAGEVHGTDYYFLSREECQEIIDNNAAAEHIEFKGNIYGIERHEIETKLSLGKIPLVIVEPHGLDQIRSMFDEEAFSIYINAPLELLYERFLDRFAKEAIEFDQPWVGKVLDIKYHAQRITSIHNEWKEWRRICDMDLYIDHFTAENKESIIDTVTKGLLRRKEKSDKS